ncbi:glycoside hydrolase superfamily [Massariosphaeria phaeospora]|uniref:chitinase n=1 Tax=Massariosphaeria phaeospora TaxID=100035 RepID=A0A7C8MKU2_9PLEO|nr:glycoside hydrolase superfamily [Massariosphaeria phaeospora]
MRTSTLLPLLAAVGGALAQFKKDGKSNVAVYWGQNSLNKPESQKRLSSYCEGEDADIIILAFVTQTRDASGKGLGLNFANLGGPCVLDPKNECVEIAKDIAVCKKNNKTVLLSLGGAVTQQTDFANATTAEETAKNIWHMFGPKQQGSAAARPFGEAVVDGLDLDFEKSIKHLPDFAKKLRELMDAGGKGKFFLSAAPQCPRDTALPVVAAQDALLRADVFDMVFVQFYNNPDCSIGGNFNFEAWNTWAEGTTSKPRVFVGVPGGETAAPGGGYEDKEKVGKAIAAVQKSAQLGGVMIWDASQAWANTDFISKIKTNMGGGSGPAPSKRATP